MNAVKRCLTILAVALVAGACGEDATAPDAGTNLSIRATPSAIWMRNNQTAEVLLEAVDKLGGAATGSWTVASQTGAFFAVEEDTAYQPTSAGPVGVKRRFVVTATGEGDGDVTFSGTGDAITIPVRVGPDTLGLDLVFTSPTQVGDTVTIPLNATVTAGLQPGLRFTDGTTVTLYTGPLTRDTSIFKTPLEFTIDPDSMHLSFKPGPNSTGRARITGIANVSTPTLATFARTGAILKTDEFDTAGSTRLPLVPATAAIGDTITVTLPPEYRFTPGTTINYFTEQPNGSMLNTNGQAAPFKISTSPDSSTIQYLPGPGVSGQPRFTGIVVTETPAWIFAARSIGTTTIPAIPFVDATLSAGNLAVNTPVTVTMPAGYKFRPTSAASPGQGVFEWSVLSRGADSNSVVLLPPPSFNSAITLSALQNSVLPPLALSLPTDDTLQVAAGSTVTNMGADDAAGSPVVAAPAAVGQAVAFYDLTTMTEADPTVDGGVYAQFYTITVANPGVYNFRVDWDEGSDMDVALMVKDGSYGAGSDLIFGSLSGAHPEAFNAGSVATPLAAGTYVLIVIDWEGDSEPTGIAHVQITRTN